MSVEMQRRQDAVVRAWLLVNLRCLDPKRIPELWLDALIIKFGLGETEVGRMRHPEARNTVSDTVLASFLGVQSRQAARHILDKGIHRFCWLVMRRLNSNGQPVFTSALEAYF
jgi:hypothetical protein